MRSLLLLPLLLLLAGCGRYGSSKEASAACQKWAELGGVYWVEWHPSAKEAASKGCGYNPNSIKTKMKLGKTSRLLFIAASAWLLFYGLKEIDGKFSGFGYTDTQSGALKVGLGVGLAALGTAGMSSKPRLTGGVDDVNPDPNKTNPVKSSLQ